MKRFSIGLVVGLVLGAGATWAANAEILQGWHVYVNGHEVCDTPMMFPPIKTIECDRH